MVEKDKFPIETELFLQAHARAKKNLTVGDERRIEEIRKSA